MFRKIGGLYWLRIGRIRIAFCRCKAAPTYRHGILIRKGSVITP